MTKYDTTTKQWRQMVMRALAVTSTCPYQEQLIYTYNITDPWQLLMSTWLEPRDNLLKDRKYDRKVLTSESEWAKATTAIRQYMEYGSGYNTAYDTQVDLLQGIRLSIYGYTEPNGFWTFERFSTLLQLCNNRIGLEDSFLRRLARPWQYMDEDAVQQMLTTEWLAQQPKLTDYLDPEFVQFIETLWHVQGSLSNASSAWKQRLEEKPVYALDMLADLGTGP